MVKYVMVKKYTQTHTHTCPQEQWRAYSPDTKQETTGGEIHCASLEKIRWGGESGFQSDGERPEQSMSRTERNKVHRKKKVASAIFP